MYIYVIAMGIVGIIVGIVIAARAKKREGVVYGGLDRAGIATNIILIPVYAVVAIFSGVLASLFWPAHRGILGILGWIVSFIGATTPALWAPGLGLSVALRKKGKSRLSFWVQFLGAAGIAVTLIIFFLCYGTLLDTLN